MQLIKSDVLVIGSGLAGVLAAIKAKEAGAQRVTMVTKGKAGKDSVSTFAAGVIHVPFPEDNQDAWWESITQQGEYLNNQEWIGIALDECYRRIVEMDKWGVEWEKTPDGKFERKMARGATPQNPVRVVMFHGPQAMQAMAKKAKLDGVEVINRVMVTDLLTSDQRVVGAVGFDTISGDCKIFNSKAIVTAAGCCAFKNIFLGHKFATGDSDAMVYRAGGELRHYENLNHNVSGSEFDTVGMNMFIALGGKFVNSNGERFLQEYDPEYGDHTLTTRWAAAMGLEVRGGRGPIYLDMTHLTPEEVRKLRVVVPQVMMLYDRAGVTSGDRFTRKLPWVVVHKGNCGAGGGAWINTKCETTLEGLYAAGDSSDRTGGGCEGYGVVGLAWAAVSGARAGKFAAEYARGAKEPQINQEQAEELKKLAFNPLEIKNGFGADHVILGVQEAIFPLNVHIILKENRLKQALAEIERIRDEEVPFIWASDPHYVRLANEARNMVTCAEMYLRSAMERKESRGTTIREDYPFRDNCNWLKWVTLKKEKGKMKVWTEDIPIERYKIKPRREKKPHMIWEGAKRRGIVKEITEGGVVWA